ncbi:MAG: hypothetical protein NT166_32535, partial [Candidatus Aminicenantes bacterium]|nr:hypothetical protein [Candidatus Aminicenantes bacterium]
MSTKTQQLFKQNLQTIPTIKSPKDLGYILIQYCQDILNLFNIDRCGILIPNSCFFFESIFVRATKE